MWVVVIHHGELDWETLPNTYSDYEKAFAEAARLREDGYDAMVDAKSQRSDWEGEYDW